MLLRRFQEKILLNWHLEIRTENKTMITEKEIDDALSTLESETSPEFAGIDFCSLWPNAKKVLELLGSITKLSWVIRIVIQVGDRYYARKCG